MKEKDELTTEQGEDKREEDKVSAENEENKQFSEEQNEHETEEPADVDEKVVELEKEVTELKNKYLRLFAEFDNFKKRTVKEKLELMRTGAQDTMSALLPVLDDFDRAKKSAEDAQTDETFSEGVALVYQKLYAVLRAQGLEPMESTGEVFDPELHEAVTDIPAPSEDLKGKVVDTIERGYKLKDKIIRHAKVVVGI